jgi:ribosomal protein S18 acetylase RimI-like enzyme
MMESNKGFIVRGISKSEYPLLQGFLYHAIYVPEGTPNPPKEAIYNPDIFIYIENFGGMHDCGIVADNGGKIIGMAWSRVIPAYGHIDNETPELSISVLPGYRNMGVGSALLTKLFETLQKRGYKKTSLSVQKSNAAVRFYKRMGYQIIKENAEDYIMLKEL